jgi:hypothetical protein
VRSERWNRTKQFISFGRILEKNEICSRNIRKMIMRDLVDRRDLMAGTLGEIVNKRLAEGLV